MLKTAYFLLGAVLGGLVGSSLALLLTPMSGDELRGEVADYTRHIQDEVERAAKTRRLELEHELASLRGEVINE